MTNEQQIREIIRNELKELLASDRYIFHKLIQILDGRNIQTGRTTGTKIGLSASEKLSVYGKSPVVQGSAISAAPSMSGTYVQSEQVVQCDRINNLITVLENIGIIAEN